MQAVSIGTLKLKDINGDTRSITIYDDFRKFPDYTEGQDDYIAIYHKSQKVGYLFSSREVYTNTDGEPTKCIFAEFIDKKGHKQYLYESQFSLREYPITSISRTAYSMTNIDEVLIDEEDFEDLPFGATLYITGTRGANGTDGKNGTNGSNPTWQYISGSSYKVTSLGSDGKVGTGGDGGRNGYFSTAKITLERENLITNELTEDHVTITSSHGYGAGGGGGGAGGSKGVANQTITTVGQYVTDPKIKTSATSGGTGGSGGIANSLPNEIIFNIPSRTKLTIDSIQISTSGTGSKGNNGTFTAGGKGGSSTDGYSGGSNDGRKGGNGSSSYKSGNYSVNFDNKSTELFFYQTSTTNKASLLNNTVSGIGGIQLNGLEYVPYSK